MNFPYTETPAGPFGVSAAFWGQLCPLWGDNSQKEPSVGLCESCPIFGREFRPGRAENSLPSSSLGCVWGALLQETMTATATTTATFPRQGGAIPSLTAAGEVGAFPAGPCPGRILFALPLELRQLGLGSAPSPPCLSSPGPGKRLLAAAQ